MLQIVKREVEICDSDKNWNKWQKSKEKLAETYGNIIYNSWFKALDFVSIEGAVLTCKAPSDFVRQWLISNYLDTITKITAEIFAEDDFCQIERIKIICDIANYMKSATMDRGVHNVKNAKYGEYGKNIQYNPNIHNVEKHAEKNTQNWQNNNIGIASADAYQNQDVFCKPNSDIQIATGINKEKGGGADAYQNLEHNIGNNWDSDVKFCLDPRFTFKNFITAQTNKVALEASKEFAKNIVKKINNQARSFIQNPYQHQLTEGDFATPLFLRGNIGSGKTHILQAIAKYIIMKSGAKLLYLSAEDFMHNFIKALRNDDMLAFKEQFKTLDVLIIDDIQFLCGKNKTQLEFLNIISHFLDAGKGLVMASSIMPSKLQLEERIKSRLCWGLMLDIEPADESLRYDILRNKLVLFRQYSKSTIEIKDEILRFIAKRVKNNIRELEGAFNKIITNSRLMGCAMLDVEKAKLILKDILETNESKVSVNQIKQKIAEHFQVKISDLSATTRKRNICLARQVAMYFTKQLTSKSLPEIGQEFGNKNHSTVIYAISKIEKMISSKQPDSHKIKSIRF